jgi:hypothetical protein
MAQAHQPCLLGMAPESFDGSADKAIAFWNTLENYYTTNAAVYDNEDKKISAALTHFKLGTQAGEWASDRMATALAAAPQTYGTWANFKDDFKAQFIPPQTQLDTITKIHNLPMGGKEFNVWYQEWSQHARRSQIDKATKMYAFRKNLNPSLHQKIIQITPQPTTLAALVDKARDLDRNWRLYGSAQTSFHGSQGPRRNPSARIWEVDTGEAPNAKINATQTKGKFQCRGRLTPGERKHCMDNNLCLYCGKPGHKAIECKAPPNKWPGTKLRQVDTIPEEEIDHTNPLDESRVNQMSTNQYAPLIDTDDVMESTMDTSF